MFLDALIRRNRPFVEAAIELHQRGEIPANSFVIDVDAVESNARLFAEAAAAHGLWTLAMTKQVGRNPRFLRAVVDGGIEAFVAVDMADARRIHATGHHVGHVGHLVQVPRSETATAAAIAPDYWTVYSLDKAQEAAEASAAAGREQPLLARIFAEGDIFYPGHEGGFPAEAVARVADDLDQLDGARFAGLTTFPALLFDHQSGEVQTTPNLSTLERAAEALRGHGRGDIEINAPGTTSSEVLPLLAAAGATQVEPGHGLTGTTPLHAVRDLPERPAVLYLSEVSHLHAGRAYAFGGGMYIDAVFPPYQVNAVVGSDPEQALADRVPAELPLPAAIDYYGMLDPPPGHPVATGDTVIFGFRIQAFVTRAFVVPVPGVESGSAHTDGIWTADGTPVALDE
ncbi:MAG: alanine racemase [Acidimicrobiales bacterium]